MYEDLRLTALRVKDFKSFAEATLHLAPLTLLIGPNASGKSNFVEAIGLLAWLAGGEKLDRLAERPEGVGTGLRGRPAELPRVPGKRLELGCSFTPQEGFDTLRLGLELAGAGFGVRSEMMTGPDLTPLYEVGPFHEGLGLDVTYNALDGQWHCGHVWCSEERLVLTQLGSAAAFGQAHERARKVIPALTGRLASVLSGARFYWFEPRRMRGYGAKDNPRLFADGGNLAGALYGLVWEGDAEGAVLEFVRELPELPVVEIGFRGTERDEVIVRLDETLGAQRRAFDAPLLSDGTLRVLAVAAAVLSAPQGSLVVIEEIDNGVHPSRARLLMERLAEVAERRLLSIIVTTHNPALVDAVPREIVPAVTCCYRDPDDGTSRLIRLQDLERYPALLAEGPLGWLMARGRIEDYAKDRSTPEQRRDAALRWLESWQETGE